MDTWLASVFGYHKEYHEHEVQVSPKVPVFSPLGYNPEVALLEAERKGRG